MGCVKGISGMLLLWLYRNIHIPFLGWPIVRSYLNLQDKYIEMLRKESSGKGGKQCTCLASRMDTLSQLVEFSDRLLLGNLASVSVKGIRYYDGSMGEISESTCMQWIHVQVHMCMYVVGGMGEWGYIKNSNLLLYVSSHQGQQDFSQKACNHMQQQGLIIKQSAN